MNTVKFIQTVQEGVYRNLVQIAEDKGITVQDLIRAVIIPEWHAQTRTASRPPQQRSRRS